jgi:hypothetical protein
MGGKMKQLTLAICVTIIAALIIGTGGCTTTNNTNQTSSAATQHNAVLESVVSSWKATAYSGNTTGENKTGLNAWQVTWLNDSSVNVQESLTAANANISITISSNDTLTAFPTTDAATAYLKSLNLSQYRLVSTDYRNQNDSLVLGTLINATGHTPSTYVRYAAQQFDLSHGVSITQFDNYVDVSTGSMTF